jgi:tRNA pseudouridine38-40 synthase
VPKLKLVLEYDGSAYHGWQKQANAVGIQNVLENKLAILLRGRVATTGAGRTDAGVHARMQTVSFSAPGAVSCKDLLRGLNGLLPRDIRAVSCEEAPAVFDARLDPIEKTYRYHWLNRPVESPFHRKFACYVRLPMDLKAMADALPCLLGRHDFSSFRAAGCQAEHPRRKVLETKVQADGELIVLSLKAEAFLHHMARIIAGTLQEVGVGKRRPEDMKKILEARDRKAAGVTAPPQGLFLWEVRYGQIPRPGRMEKLQELAATREAEAALLDKKTVKR